MTSQPKVDTADTNREEMSNVSDIDTEQRSGDTVLIDGDYQYRALHGGNAVQRFWHRSKQDVIASLLLPGACDYVLDVGCGSGTVSAYLGTTGATVLGLDANPAAVAFASRRYGTPSVAFEQKLVDEEFQPGRPVDKIYCMEVLEHIFETQGEKMLRNFRRILRPGGCVLLTTPNYHSLWPLIELLMDRFHLAPPMAAAQHVERYHRKKLLALVARAGFSVHTCRSTCFLAPWVAPVSGKLAAFLHRCEIRSRLLFGSILVCVFQKDESA
jgi:2-polyprenyl-3-methyl-5-hydroxy-6-metoxy-1,4-benzoquinol methylase